MIRHIYAPVVAYIEDRENNKREIRLADGTIIVPPDESPRRWSNWRVSLKDKVLIDLTDWPRRGIVTVFNDYAMVAMPWEMHEADIRLKPDD